MALSPQAASLTTAEPVVSIPLLRQARQVLASAEKSPLSTGTRAFKNETTFALTVF